MGLSTDLGLTIEDRVALFVHLELGTAIVTVIGSLGLIVEYAWGDRFSAGIGVAVSGWRVTYSGPGGYYGLTFPLRLNFAPLGRGLHQVARKGLLLGLQVAPGVSLQPASFDQQGPPDPSALTAMLSVTYAVW